MLEVGAPSLLTALSVGVLISLLQALTQIQESTLSFLPKLVAILGGHPDRCRPAPAADRPLRPLLSHQRDRSLGAPPAQRPRGPRRRRRGYRRAGPGGGPLIG